MENKQAVFLKSYVYKKVNMEGLTLQVYNWLSDIEEHESANFLIDCTIDNTYVDTYFEIGNELCHDM